MGLKSIQTLELILALIITATIIWYRASPSILGAGIAFLMASCILCSMGVAGQTHLNF